MERPPGALAATRAVGRFTEPDEVAQLIAYLASPHAASITGAEFLIDGGLVKTA